MTKKPDTERCRSATAAALALALAALPALLPSPAAAQAQPAARAAAGRTARATAASAPRAADAASPGAASSPGAADAPFELSVASIMRGPELVGEAPTAVRWTPDSRWVYFRWKPGGRPWYEPLSLYRVRATGGEPRKLSDAEADSLGVLVARGDDSRDGRWRVVSHDGDLFLVDRRSLDVRRLTETRDAELGPLFSRDGASVYFVSSENLFAIDTRDGAVRQLTDFRHGASSAEEKEAKGQRGFLKEQQTELFETIRVREEREKREKELREQREREAPRTVHVAADERVADIAVEPGGRYAAVLVVHRPKGAESTVVPEWVTESGYVETIQGRSKVGDEQGAARLGLVDLSTGDVKWLNPPTPGAAPTAGGGEGGRAAGAAGGADTAAAGADTAAAGAPRFARLSFLGWNDAGTQGLVGVVSFAHKDEWLEVLDAASGELRPVMHDHDDAWIGGPCETWADDACAGWLPGSGGFWFISERDGWSHLYRAAADGSGLKQLTDGQWEVHDATLSRDRRTFYMHTTEASPFGQQLYRMAVDGGSRVRLTQRVGLHSATLSPDGARLADVYSYANQPPELFLRQSKPGATPERVTTSPTAQWSSYAWIVPDIIRIPARDGAQVPARIYRPADVGAQANGGAVIFVHGAGYLHNVHNGWSDYYREYMFNHLLASHGYVVLDLDYRGSAGYGRDWRTAIYRHMGGKDLTDQVDAVKYLVANEGVQGPERVGIYGGSYGGFITLMALFTEPDWFGAGAALRAVTDWAHYNHWYTSRILNLPQDDSVAYRQSSPIYFAEGLKDPLLIAHGMQDTNVEFQDVVRLSQRLIELKKTGWQLAVFPVENHGFVEPTSWTDEYRRILDLFDRTVGRAVASR